MVARDEILGYLDELLDPGAFEDYSPNGLQVPGSDRIHKVVTGVSATLDLFEEAVERDADLVLTHHGIFWNGSPEALTLQQARRLRILLTQDVNLASYHLPLDAHAEVGNNALLCDALGLERGEPFGKHHGQTIGWIGRAPQPLSPQELRGRIASELDREPLIFEYGPSAIERIAIVSGGASGYLREAIDAGADAFMTGEPAERVMAESREGGIHFIAAGHYATETMGIRRLGELIAERFDVLHEFVDLPNPV
jgi:dinuclear metal center YbgI/SA1388 family protein